MVMLPLLVSGLMASVSVAGPMEIRGQVEHHCATRGLSLEDQELFTRHASQPDDGQEINLGCVLHLCCGQGGECPPDSVAQETVEDMNGLLAKGKIKFTLQNISRINDPRCTAGVTNNGAMDALKSQVHQGNTSTLNVVYVPTNQGAGVKGMCVVPQPGTDIASSIGGADGCVVAMDTLPKDNGGNDVNGHVGGSNGGSGGGNGQLSGAFTTTTHEMGHWLGENHVNGGSKGGFSGGLLRRQGGGSTGNIMEPVSMPGKQYSFSQAQLKRMRQMALARLNNQKAPVGDKNSPQFP
ncbi:peptidase M12 family protein, partial [Metarhizium robertsii]